MACMHKKYKILVVDDQRDNLMRIVEMIEEKFSDCEIFHALDGNTALKISIKEQPDLIILDWEMPGLNGIETTRKLKDDPSTQEIPVIICTGKMTSSSHLETALAAGAVDYIRKPLDKIELLARLQSMLLLSDSYKRIKNLNENKNKLLSIIAHDLKNPLYTVKLLMDYLQSPDLTNEKRNDLIKGVSSSVASAFGLLENLLAWANSQRNMVIYQPGYFKLSEIVNESLNLLQLSIANKELVVENHVLPEILVFADKNMMSVTVRNILSNAVKYSLRKGKVKLMARERNNMVEFTVADSGTGFAETDLSMALQEEICISRPGTNMETGSGIGLRISREYVKINNGTLNIESQQGKGSSITICLPVHTPEV